MRYQEFLDGIEPSERIYHAGDPAAAIRAALRSERIRDSHIVLASGGARDYCAVQQAALQIRMGQGAGGGSSVEARVSIVGGDQADLESLDLWLRQEGELAGRVTFAGAKPRPGELGALGEALIVAVGSGGAVSALASSLKAWMALPRRSDVRIRVEGPGGRVVEIDAHRVGGERIDDLVRQALESAVDNV